MEKYSTDQSLKIQLLRSMGSRLQRKLTPIISELEDAVKAGQLNLWFSYKYLSLRKYLINDARWENHSEEIVNDCELKLFSNFDQTISLLNERLNEKYEQVNINYKEDRNKYLSFNKKGELIIATPKTREQKIKNKLAPIFGREGIVPIPRVLDGVNRATNFVNSFKHHAIKNVIMKPSPETIYAGLLSKGCNHGTI